MKGIWSRFRWPISLAGMLITALMASVWLWSSFYQTASAFSGKPLSPQEVVSFLKRSVPRLPVDAKQVQYLPKLGMYEIHLRGSQSSLYLTADLKHAIHGTLFELQGEGQPWVNLTMQSQQGSFYESNKERVDKLIYSASDEHFIVYPPKGPKRATIYVFTDLNCPYCRRFHVDVMPELLEKGIEVRYISTPVVRPPSSVEAAEAIFCLPTQSERRDAMDLFESGGAVPSPNPACQGFSKPYIELFRDLGARGTPFVLLSDGRTLNGMLSAERIETMLGL